MNTKDFIKTVKAATKKNASAILVGVGIAGMISSTVLAVKATPKVMEVCKQVERDKTDGVPTKTEYVKATWKYYIPSVAVASVSIVCIVGANTLHMKRNAALMAVYTVTDTAFKDYASKTLEVVGEKKEAAIRDAIAKDRVDSNPVPPTTIMVPKRPGTSLCMDSITGQYFYSDMESIRRAMNSFNRDMLGEEFLSLNEWLTELGVNRVAIGDELGWRVDHGLLDIHFSSQVASNGDPCLVLEYRVRPGEFGY